MNILLTNDDGYDQIGILLLKKHLKKYGRVIIVAPKTTMSAKSVSITVGKTIKVVEEEKDTYSVEGTPADCVSFGLSSLGVKFDIVISGCNAGWNISYDTLYSGTIGACLESLTYRVPAIAVSTEYNFEIVDKYFDMVLDYIFDKLLFSVDYLINVNFPLGENVNGIEITNLYYYKEAPYFEKRNDGYYALRNLSHNYDDDPHSDGYMVHHSYVSITPLNKTLFYPELINVIKSK